MRKFLLSLFAAFSFCGAQSQDLLTRGTYSGGDYKTNGTNNLSFTIGEAITGAVTNGDYSVDQGQQQNFKAFLVTQVKEIPATPVAAKAWPNPASDALNVTFPPGSDIASVALLDVAGKQLKTEGVFLQGSYRLAVSDLAPGTYLLVFRHAAGNRQTLVRFLKAYR